MAAIIVSSAYLRLTTMGIGCEPWPACYGRLQTPAPARAEKSHATSVTIARLLHRAAAMLVAILAVLTLLLSLVSTVRSARNVSLATGIVVLTFMLAAVGRVSATLLVPAVGVANLLGGFGLLACFWALHLDNRGNEPRGCAPKRVRSVAGIMLLLFALQAAAGALNSVTYSADVCPSLWVCTAPQEPGNARGLNVFEAQPVDADGKVVAAPAAAGIQTAHRVLGIASAALFALFGLWLLTRFPAQRAGGACLLALASIEGAIGVVMAAHGFPLIAAITHNAAAAALMLVLVGLAWPRTSARAADRSS